MSEQEVAQAESHMSLVHGIMLQLSQVANRAEQIVLIIDLKRIKVKTFSNKMINAALKKAIGLGLQYFPGLLAKGFIVNAPMSFSQLWGTYESNIPAETLAKIRVIGGASDPDISVCVSSCRKAGVGADVGPPRYDGRDLVSRWYRGEGRGARERGNQGRRRC